MSNRFERTSDKKTVEKHLKILKDLLQQPDNKICADCKKRDPRWASANLGIFICLRCSGIHRSLGVHISKVRSVDLDTWTQDHIDNMLKWGNARANKYWEHSLGPNHTPDDSRMESFIRSKYEYKKFVMSGPIPEDPSVLDGSAKQQQQQQQKSAVTEQRGTIQQQQIPQAASAGVSVQPSYSQPQQGSIYGNSAAPFKSQQPVQQNSSVLNQQVQLQQQQQQFDLLGLNSFEPQQPRQQPAVQYQQPQQSFAPAQQQSNQVNNFMQSKPAANNNNSNFADFAGISFAAPPSVSAASGFGNNTQSFGNFGNQYSNSTTANNNSTSGFGNQLGMSAMNGQSTNGMQNKSTGDVKSNILSMYSSTHTSPNSQVSNNSAPVMGVGGGSSGGGNAFSSIDPFSQLGSFGNQSRAQQQTTQNNQQLFGQQQQQQQQQQQRPASFGQPSPSQQQAQSQGGNYNNQQWGDLI
ncbi:hypothetical protein MP228_008837 [Amoeboaphelidium protococcarum]|nr:hypothetical protein MP228_008837 [Amoeboaphelidium protococcarum]